MKDSNRMLLESSLNTLGEMKINSRQSVSNMSSFIAASFAKKTSDTAEAKGDFVKLKKILAFLNNVLNKKMNAFSFKIDSFESKIRPKKSIWIGVGILSLHKSG